MAARNAKSKAKFRNMQISECDERYKWTWPMPAAFGLSQSHDCLDPPLRTSQQRQSETSQQQHTQSCRFGNLRNRQVVKHAETEFRFGRNRCEDIGKC